MEQAFVKLAELALKRQDELQKQMDETMLSRRAQERERNQSNATKKLGRPDRRGPAQQDGGC